MARLIKTRGIVVRHAAYSESSRIIQWITEDHGRLVTIAKGAMRPRNPLLGQFDQLYTCELIYYTHERDALYITREVSPVQTRPRFRTDWRAALAAMYIVDLATHVLPHHESAPDVFHFIEDTLQEIHERGWHAPTLFLAELRLLALMGLTPRLDRCATCDTAFKAGEMASFSSRRGGMICRQCEKENGDHRVGADVLAMLRHWQPSPGWNTVRSARCTAPQLDSIRLLLGDFLTFHLDIPRKNREASLALILSTKPPNSP